MSPAPGKQGRPKSNWERRNSAGPPKRSKSRSQSRGHSSLERRLKTQFPSKQLAVKRQKQKAPRFRPRKIDQRNPLANGWTNWLYDPYWISNSPRNLEFHNFSSLELTAPQSKTLGFGLKFRPTLKPPSVAQFLPQIQDFCRSVCLHKKFKHQPDDPDFNLRLFVKSEWNPPREDPHLEDSLYHIREKLCPAKPQFLKTQAEHQLKE